ncbi:uncharacterized protein [Macrobrachium rosenbergii]|uniref:uncharacterized protein n=1 Tax=Macrobrachium rosenbergii TaxID=79674 RepID=UPI0034D5B513
MQPAMLTFALVLTVGSLAHCRDWENLLFIKMEAVLEKQEAALKKQEAALSQLKEMQEKLQHVENNLQELHHAMEHLKGAATDNQDSLQNECSEGIHNCGDYEACTDKLVRFTCSCAPGFARNGSRCEDIDECAQGKAECSPQATCRNSIGSYSCSCNPPFEGDGRTCEFSCKSPAKVYEGLGCVRAVYEPKTWHQMNATCQEAGWRLPQDIRVQSKDVDRAFPYGGWIGVYEGKWLESGIHLEEGLWKEGYPSDPSRRCGYIHWDFSSPHSYNVNQYKCSDTSLGYCQFVL